MKKLLCAGVLLAALCASTFADTELGFNYTGILYQVSTGSYNGNTVTVNNSAPGGIEWSGNFYWWTIPIANKYTLDLGLNVDWAMVMWTKSEIKYKSQTVTLNDDNTQINFLFNLGPAARFNLTKTSSFYFSPGVKVCGYGLYKSYQDTKTVGTFFSMDFGYRQWLVNTERFHLGAIGGIEFGFGGDNTRVTMTSSSSSGKVDINASSVQGLVYVGICIDFGYRGYEKQVNKWNMATLPVYDQSNAYVLDAKTLDDNFSDNIVLTSGTTEQNISFAVYAYDFSNEQWKHIGDAALPVAGGNQKIYSKNLDYYRYFAIVPLHTTSKPYTYTFEVSHNDLIVTVR